MRPPRGIIKRIVENRMYSESVMQWNPFKGCLFDCIYCRPSFQRQSRRIGKKRCALCYYYIPHFHPERLKVYLPPTEGKQFVFCVSSGDISFAKLEQVEEILERIGQQPDTTFLIQSKNPECFMKYNFPENVILDTTIETNRDELCRAISKAPMPSQRYEAMLKVKHPRKFVTIEPILEFDIETITAWIRKLRPEVVYIGYDSHNCKLKEPPLWKTQILFSTLYGITEVRCKTIRKAWDER